MKSRIVPLIVSALLLTFFAHAQQIACHDTVLVAGFGLDGELYSNDTVVGGDDWFADSTAAGNSGVIGTTAATAMPPLQISASDFRNLMANAVTSADRNLTYGQRMAVPVGTVRPLPNGGSAVLLDAFYFRDNSHGDSTGFSLNNPRYVSNPTTSWQMNFNYMPSNSDILEAACHIRREYDSLNRPKELVLFNEFISKNSIADASYDIFIFRKDVSLDYATGSFSGSGDSIYGGHTPFEFNSDGSINRQGDICFHVNFNSGSSTITPFVWVSPSNLPTASSGSGFTAFDQLVGRPFNFTGSFDGLNGFNGYGFAEISPLVDSLCHFRGIGNGQPIYASPWGSLISTSNTYVSFLNSGTSFETSIDLTELGLDKHNCDSIMGTIMITSLSSGSSNAILVDAIPPIPFGNFPELSAEAGPTAYLDCNHPTVSLTGSTVAPYAQPLWTTMDGHVVSGDTSFTLTVDSPGTYYLQVSDPLLSSCAAIDSVVVLRVPAPVVPTVSLNGNLLESSSAFAYQWYLDGQLIPSAGSQQYQALVDGDYQVQTTDSFGCTAVSAIIPVFSTGADYVESTSLQIYPNPVTSFLYVERLPVNAQEVRLEDLSGRIVQSVTLNTNDRRVSMQVGLSKGLYLFRCTDAAGKTLAVRKVVAG